MIRFLQKEYIRNIWFHLCMVLILLVMMLSSTILISNVAQETRLYRLADQYIDDDSMFLSYADDGFIEELTDLEVEVHGARNIFGCLDPNTVSSITATVYEEKTMEYLTPRLESGRYPDSVQVDDNTICALISSNPYGIKAGDTFTYYISKSEDLNAYIQVQVYVTGIISEGQSLYIEAGEIFSDMTYEDFFQIYSYEQTEEVRLIIPEEEMKKFPQEKVASVYANIMIDPSDNLAEEVRGALQEKVTGYEEERWGIGSMSAFPKASELVERSELKHQSVLLKYVPLIFIIILLFTICIIAIVTIKTVKSTRDYGIMYACGMEYRKAQFMTGLEMTFNCMIAFLGTVVLVVLQNAFNLVGVINCEIDGLKLSFMAGICVITIASSIFTTRSILKEQTPVQILKNRG